MRPLLVLVALIAVVFGASAMPITAATPPNDNRANAQVLAVPTQVTGTTVDATAEANDPQCQPKARETVWYRFTRTTPGPILVDFQAAGQLDAVVGVLRQEQSQLRLLRCEPTDARGRTLFTFEANPARNTTETYFLLVGQRLNSDPGGFALSISSPPRPPNDERPGATPLETLPAAATGTTIGATADEGDPGCAGRQPTVWHLLSQPKKSRVSIRLHAVGNLDASVCAVQRVRSQLRFVGDDATDDKGNAAFAFDARAGATYYVVVAQQEDSEPGAFRIAASSPTRPANDELPEAVAIKRPPSTTRGTTLGATQDEADPGCVSDGPTVWYRLYWSKASTVVVRFRAPDDLDAGLCILTPVRERARTQARRFDVVENDVTNERGDVDLSFEGPAGTTYYLAVEQVDEMVPVPFSLTILRPDEPPVPPGELFSASSGKGFLHPLLDPDDAWAVPLTKGASYRFTVVDNSDAECLSLAIYRPRTKSFDDVPVGGDDCAEEAVFFTPGPDGGGIYPVLLAADREPTAYRLYVSRVQADDSGPGVLIKSGQRVTGAVSPADPLDLYRFDVTIPSNVRVGVTARRDISVQLTNSTGQTIKGGAENTDLVRVLGTGTYYVAVRPGDRTARYLLRVLVRYVTVTRVTVNGERSTKVEPGVAVSLETTTEPDPGPGTTRVQADFFDVGTGTWVFRELWDVSPNSAISFTPDAVGRWRVRATFNGNQLASRSRSAYSTIFVSTV